jgi:hypothetical protein
MTVRSLTSYWRVALASAAVALMATAPPSAAPTHLLSALRGDVWLLPAQSWPTAACYVNGELWVTLEGQSAFVVFDDSGSVTHLIPLDSPPCLLNHDRIRRCLYATTPAEAAMEIIDLATYSVCGSVPLPMPAVGVTIVADRAYVNAAAEASVYVVDLRDQRVVQVVQLSQPGFESVVVGDSLYVATGAEPGPGNKWSMSGAAVDIVDLTNLRLTKTLPLPGAHLRAVAWDGGHYVYAASNVGGRLVRLDTNTDTLDDGFEVEVGRVNDIVIDPTRKVAVLSCTGAHEEVSVVRLDRIEEAARYHGGQGFMAMERDTTGALRDIWVPNVNESHILHLNATALMGD